MACFAVAVSCIGVIVAIGMIYGCDAAGDIWGYIAHVKLRMLNMEDGLKVLLANRRLISSIQRIGWGVVAGALLMTGCSKSKRQQDEASTQTKQIASTQRPASVGADSEQNSASAESRMPKVVWKGVYDSQKAVLDTPKKVTDVTWKKDDGSVAVGKGELSVVIDQNHVSGHATGSLGAQAAVGLIDGDMLRIGFVATDPSAPQAMTCKGTAILKEGIYQGQMRCLDPKAVIIRHVLFSLKQEAKS